MPLYRGTELRISLIRHCPPRSKKDAEYITIYLQSLNRLSGKDAPVLGK